MATHEIHRVETFSLAGPHSLRITFEDGAERTIDFSTVLFGDLFSPLKDPNFFALVRIDPEVHTLVWPNGADFDPETLYNWARYEAAMMEHAATLAAR